MPDDPFAKMEEMWAELPLSVRERCLKCMNCEFGGPCTNPYKDER